MCVNCQKNSTTIEISNAKLVTSSPPGQNGCHFADDISVSIFVNETFCILIKISLKFCSYALVQIMAWRQIGEKPLSEPMLTHSCGTRGR